MKKNIKKGTVIYVYRYLWKFKGSENENVNIKVVCGVQEEHDKFINALKNDDDVKIASRVYMHEYDFEKMEEYESVKVEIKEKDGEL